MKRAGSGGAGAARAGSPATLEAVFNKAASDKIYAGRKGRVPRNTVRSLLGRFAVGGDDGAAVTAIVAALPVSVDSLVSYAELQSAVRKVAVRRPRAPQRT